MSGPAKWLQGLIVGGRETASMGRALLWLAMALAVYFWLARPPELFPPTLRDALACLLAYNLGSKALGKVGGGSGDEGDGRGDVK